MFTVIRERLNAIDFERTEPKLKIKRSKLVYTSQVIDNQITAGSGGKAGVLYNMVQVREVTSFYYKTYKPQHHSSPQITARKVITIDLHGLTKSKALAELDMSLPKWINTAMK